MQRDLTKVTSDGLFSRLSKSVVLMVEPVELKKANGSRLVILAAESIILLLVD